MRILVVEPELSLRASLQKGFEVENFLVDLAATGEEAKVLVLKREYHAAILDIDLPHEHGLQTLRELRSRRQQLPILILATGARPGQRAQTLDLGADDLLLKPFELSELLARVRALLRRGGRQPEPVLRIDNLELSRVEHVVTRAGKKIRLTPKEFALLEYLLANAGQRVTRSEIAHYVWHQEGDILTNIVDVYVNYLRKKVDLPFDSKLIHTVRGVGYQLQARSASGGQAA